MQQAVLRDGVVTYNDEEFTFEFKIPKEAFYQTTIVKPATLKVIKNSSGLPTSAAKKKIIEEWFAEDNLETRLRNNEKRRSSKEN